MTGALFLRHVENEVFGIIPAIAAQTSCANFFAAGQSGLSLVKASGVTM